MTKTYLPYDPDQQLLLPQALQEWLPENHLAYFISDVANQLDLSEITAHYKRERRGGPPYHPLMMVKVLLYAYCVGVPSSRKIAQRLHEDIAFRVLAANNTPDFRTISDFRKDHLEALSGLFLQVLAFCQGAGMVKLGHVALDGTKVRANASKHKAMSYQRMREQEAPLQGEVDELLRRAQEVDEEEDKRYGKDKRSDQLPEELSFREGRLERIREAMAALEAEAQAAAEEADAAGKEHPGVPEDKAQRNFTDPESRIMPGSDGRDFLQAYNCPAVVDHEHQVIIAARATNQASDKQQAVGMSRKPSPIWGQCPRKCRPMPATTRPRRWQIYMPWARTPSSRRRRPDTASNLRQRPEGASPSICPPGTGCGGSCRPSGGANATRSAWPRWSRSSARSSRAEGSGSSCCVGWIRCRASGR